MNINTSGGSSSYVNSASSNKGFSGLASGVDTEKMVEQLLSGTQNKIDKQNAVRQQLVWKQEIYRDIISSINSFQSKYFSVGGSSNLLSQSFFNAMGATTSSNHFKVTATSSASVGKTSVAVQRLASVTKLTSGSGVSGKLQGKIDTEAFQDMVEEHLTGERTVTFDVDGTKVEVDFTDIFVKDGKFTDLSESEKNQAIADRINSAMAENDLGETVTAEVKYGKLTMTSLDEKKAISVDEDSSALGLSALGLSASDKSSANTVKHNQTLTSTLAAKSVYSFNVSLDDSQKVVEIDLSKIVDGDGKVDLDQLKNEMQSKIDLAHGAGQITVASNAGDASFELQVSAGRKVMIAGTRGDLEKLGFQNGQSNRIGVSSELKDLYFANGLQGSRFSFSINGKEFEFKDTDAIGDIMAEVNGAGAGVRIVYKPLEDKFVMESTSSGVGHEIRLEQKEGNLLNAMFGSGVDGTLKTGSSVTSGLLTIEVPDPAEGESPTAPVTGDMTLAEAGLSGLVTGGAGDDTKLKDLESLGIGLSFQDGRITFTGSGDAASVGTPELMEKLFGSKTVSLGADATDADGNVLSRGVYERGENALVEIDGILTERSSNSFTVNGLNIELTSVSEETSPGVFKADTIETTRGTDQIMDGIKSFINDYNELIGKLNKLVDQEANYRDYPPLTSAQKKEMSEREIELWEEKAKEGLLRRDSAVDEFLQSMRSVLYTKPDGCSYAIYNLGIQTSDAWEDKGKLVMDADGEVRLRQILESNPDEVLKLFTDSQQGIAVQMNKVITKTANLSSGSPGTLVQIAGVKGRASDKDNDIYDRLKDIDSKIAALKRTYEKEKTRYWNQFNAMESALSNLNAQSSWLMQMLGS